MLGVTQAIKAVAILAIVLSIFIGGYYITGLRADLAVSEENTKKLSGAIELQQQAMTMMAEDQKKIQKTNAQITETINRQNQDVNSLRDKFNKSSNGESRDLGKAAIAKPVAIQNTINKASAKAIRCMEIASGSPLTKEERNETNSECPSLTSSN